jgi:hypothetical protein
MNLRGITINSVTTNLIEIILLLLLVYSIPSTSDDYILLHAWTVVGGQY